MKKNLWITCGAVAMIALSGCSDAKAEISDGDKIIAKVGNEEITKEKLYTTMKMSNAYNTVIEKVTKKIVDKEAPASEEMKTAAKTAFEEYKKSVGNGFADYLKNSGYKDEDSFYKNIYLVDQQKSALYKKYTTKNYKKLVNEYRPMKAQIIASDTEEKAKEALAAVKGDTSFEDAAKAYGNTTNFNGSVQLVNSKTAGMSSVAFTQMKSVKKTNFVIDKVINDATTGKFYVVKVIDNDPNNFKEEAIQSVAQISEVADKALAFYLDKYKFTIYDVDVYNSIQESKPSFIVQD